jgi:hypothetical protein
VRDGSIRSEFLEKAHARSSLRCAFGVGNAPDSQVLVMHSQKDFHCISWLILASETDAVEGCIELVSRILGIKSSTAEHQDILLLRYDRRMSPTHAGASSTLVRSVLMSCLSVSHAKTK